MSRDFPRAVANGAARCTHCNFGGYRTATGGTGDVFFEDTIGKPIHVMAPQKAWGRQVNCEFGDKPLIVNQWGALWVPRRRDFSKSWIARVYKSTA